MAGKNPRTIPDQIQLLQSRDMLFRDINNAPHFLANISYYRLKGYWWDMQDDKINHHFAPNSYFEEVIDWYNFDRHFRLIVFNAVERIEIALRTKLIHHLSLQYGECWYIDHHSRLWNRVIITKYSWPKNMEAKLLDFTPNQNHLKKIFALLAGMIYLNDKISPGHSLKKELVDLIQQFPNVPFYKMGFPPNWQDQPIFR